MEFDYLHDELITRRNELIGEWQPYVNSVNAHMEKDGFSPLTQEQAGKMCEGLDFFLKNAEVGMIGPRLAQVCADQMAKAIEEQQK